MSEFLAAYGLWILIALLVVIVIFFLLSGKKDKGSPLNELVAAPRPDPVVAPEPEPEPLPVVDAAPEPVTLTTGAAPVIVTPEPEAPAPKAPAPAATPAPEPEPVAAAEPAPAATPKPKPAAKAPASADNLLLLKGVGPKLGALLTELGITSFAQVAAWTDSDIAAIDAKLGNFKGRPVRDQWVDQAKYLAAGDTAGFEAKYGKL